MNLPHYYYYCFWYDYILIILSFWLKCLKSS